MTFTCDLDLELAWLTRVLQIDSLKRTFDQSLTKIFQRVQEIWSGQESVMEGHADGLTDGQKKAISIIPHPLRGRGLIKYIAKSWSYLCNFYCKVNFCNFYQRKYFLHFIAEF